jgi:tetratricopeptide (TPR) repeat protein
MLGRATVLNFRNSFDLYDAHNIYTDHVLVRIYTFLATLPSYFSLLIAPHDLHMERDFPVYAGFFAWPDVIGTLIFLLMLLSLIWGLRRRRYWMMFAPAWIFAAFVPQTGVLIPVNGFLLEHWLYLPSLALALTGFYVLEKWGPRKAFTISGTLLMAVILGTLTFRQNRVWSDPIGFYEHILKYSDGSLRVHNNLAMAYESRGDFERAIREYNIAIRMNPKMPNPRHNLALLYLNEGKIAEAKKNFEKALASDPQFYYSLPYLAQIYGQEGDVHKAQEAIERYREIRSHLQFPGRH